jgi:AraC-like DNA-binding protein
MKTSPALLPEHANRPDAEKKVATGHAAYIFRSKQQSVTAPNLPPYTAGLRRADEIFLQKVRMHIEQRLPDDIRVGDLAKALYCTRVQVFRKIKSLTGQSPSRFIRKLRLDKSLELLKKTDLSIAEIAYSVGFDDPKYFTRVFVAAYGKAPSIFCK